MGRSNVASGYDIVQFKYLGWGWPNPIEGNKQGFLRLACRPATIIKWVHDNWHRSGTFMVIGSSQGSAALGYSMAMYGVHQFVDRAVYISGPPMTELVTACLATDNRQLAHPSESWLVDEPDGYLNSYGPCTLGQTPPIIVIGGHTTASKRQTIQSWPVASRAECTATQTRKFHSSLASAILQDKVSRKQISMFLLRMANHWMCALSRQWAIRLCNHKKA